MKLRAGSVRSGDLRAAAIACYRGVGFDVRHAYDEWLVTAI